MYPSRKAGGTSTPSPITGRVGRTRWRDVMPIDVHGRHGATLHEVHREDARLLGIAYDLFLSIFPEDKHHLSYVRACAYGRYPCHPNTVDHVWLVEQAAEWVGLRLFSFLLTRNFGYGVYVGL